MAEYCSAVHTIGLRTKRSKGRRALAEISELLDLLLHAEPPSDLRPLDMFDSGYFPSLTKLGDATRHLKHPFHICHLVERRKAIAIFISMLDDSSDTFGFAQGVTPMHRIREIMVRDTYNRFERHILNIANIALPLLTAEGDGYVDQVETPNFQIKGYPALSR